jgi:putative nucleotidyltransferase with HDIG domain
VGLLVAIFALQPNSLAQHLGAVATDTVVAQHKVTYIDRQATAAKRHQAMDAVQPAYVNDPHTAQIRTQQATAFFNRAAPIISSQQRVSEKLIAIRHLVPVGLTSTDLQEFASLTPADFQIVRDRSISLLTQAQAWHFDSNQTATTELQLLSTVSSRVTLLQRASIGEVLSTFLAATLSLDSKATAARKKAAAARVAPVTSTIFPGEVIVRRGDMVTPAVMEKLRALGLQHSQVKWQDTLASFLFSGTIVLMLFWYLHSFHGVVPSNPRLLLLIDVSILATVLGAQILAPGHVLLPYFLPVAAAPTFAAVLIAPEACIAIALSMAVLSGWISAGSFELTVYYFLTSAAGVLAIRHIRRVKQFILAGGYIAVFAALTILAFGLVQQNYDIVAMEDFAAAAGFNGLVSASLALGGFALLSEYFGVTTSLQLLELGQPNQPLLRRLMVKAPGTYNHSLIIASMVEHAAEEIGADSLVAKAGAMYHDIGKSVNPHAFIENQLGRGNIHDELRPEESARLIRGHVTQGLRLARQHRLPRVILDAIAEHHGTMTISYFLHRAHEFGTLSSDLSLYSYPGPKPQTRETALIMLADACESAVRSMTDHAPDRIEDMVDRIFRERIELGQLSECPLTLADLEAAREAFLSVLNGLYHPRIEYPEPSESMERGLAQ